MASRLPYVWDYNIDEDQFRVLLAGRLTLGRLDRRWAAARVLEYAPYREIIRQLGYRGLVGWPEWRPYVRSTRIRRGLDFWVEWLKENHPELI